MKMILNPNEKVVKAIQGRLKMTNGMCPCVSEDKWNEDYMCPCRKFREENKCCCSLYVEDKTESEIISEAVEKISEEAKKAGIYVEDLAKYVESVVTEKKENTKS